MDHKGGTTIVCHECWGVGNNGYWFSSDAPEDTGSMTLYNCVCETPAGLSGFSPYGAWMSGNGGSLTIYNCTFFADAAATNYIGIHAATAGGTVIAKNNIIDGFNVGVSTVAGAAFTSDYNLINATTNYTGVTPGAHDIIAPSGLVKPPTNMMPTSLSKAVRNAVPIAGVTIDYPGNFRSTTTPTIGAFEFILQISSPLTRSAIDTFINMGLYFVDDLVAIATTGGALNPASLRLRTELNRFTIVPANGTAMLPSILIATAQRPIVVVNESFNSLTVYAYSDAAGNSEQINGAASAFGSTNGGLVVPVNTVALFLSQFISNGRYGNSEPLAMNWNARTFS
jgi:hypothetical protein